jgi:hypothetical protein
MKSKVGLWIDHRKAIIVIITNKGKETKQITSQMEKHVRYSNGLQGLKVVLWNTQ